MGILETLDVQTMQTINSFVGLHPVFDRVVRLVADWPALRCAPLVLALWWAWFAKPDKRTAIVSGLVASSIAALLSRIMQVLFYVHPRPFAVAAFHGLTLPSGVKTDWGHGSSFPSDTATLHIALATTILTVAPRLAPWAIAWSTLVIALPRAYLTYHWPSDVIAGGLLGAAFVFGSARSTYITQSYARLASFSDAAPQWFYPAAFIATYFVMTSFDDVVQLLRLTEPQLRIVHEQTH